MKKLFFLALLLGAVSLSAKTSYMSDGALIQIGVSYMTENFVRPGDIPELQQGSLFYDPENHVLTLSNVLIESNDPAAFGLALSCLNMAVGSQKMEVRVVGSNIIRITRDFSAAAALMLGGGDFVITGMNGDLKLMSNNGIGLGLGCDDLIIRDGVYIHAGYSESGLQSGCGVAPIFVNPKVTILCASLEAYGTTRCIDGIDPALMYADLTDEEKSAGYQYNSSKNYWVDGSNTLLKETSILFKPTKHIFQWFSANPEGGTITVTKDGNPLSYPYYYGKDEENVWVDILATPNEGWEFVAWRTCDLGAVWNNSEETTYGLPELSQTGMLIGYFRHKQHEAPTKPWYLLSEYYEKISSFEDWVSSPTVVTESFLSDMHATKLKFATYAEGRLYYIDQEDVNKSGLYSVAFDPSEGKMSDVQMHINAQDVYQKFYCLTYNVQDGCLYGVASKSDNEQYLVWINLKANTISQVGRIENTDINNGVGVYLLAADNKGELYGIFKVGEQNNMEKSPFRHGSMLVKISKSNAAITPVGWTGQYFEDPSCSMAFDYKSGDLIATSYSTGMSFVFSIDVETGWATPLQTYTSYCNGIFQTMPKSVAVSVNTKYGDEDKGNAVILDGGIHEAKYFVGDQVDIEAMPSSNEFRFVQWSDGSTENPRTIDVTDVASITMTAEFDWAEDVVFYPIWINGKQRQLTSHSGELTIGNCSFVSGGSITFDPETNTLTLEDLDIEAYSGDALTIGDKSAERLTLTVKMVGNSPLATYEQAVVYIENADVTFVGDGDIQCQSYYTSSAYVLDHATVTFEGVNMKIEGNDYGIKGVSDASVVFRGATMEVSGLDGGAIGGLTSMATEHCDITAPTGAAFNPETQNVEDAGGIVKGSTAVVIKGHPQIQCVPVEAGSGSFTIASADEQFENIGWVAAGTPLTLTAVPAEGYVFARWTDDVSLPASREVTKGIDYEVYKALFFVETPEESKWFGVHKSKFMSFDLAEYGAVVAKATAPDGTSVSAGELVEGDWIFVDGTDIKKMLFEELVDGEDLSGASSITTIVSGAPAGITDMAYSHAQETLYAVAGSSLYQIEENTCTEVGTFEHNSITVKAVSIAIDADTMYILASGDPGALYTVYIIDESLKKVYLEPVGEHKGSVNEYVGTGAQSMVFDANVGQLLWGAYDYMRYIHPKTAKTSICGDLEQSGGAQMPVISLHNGKTPPKILQVSVTAVEEGSGSFTIASADEEFENVGWFLQGTEVTITAQAANGFEFVRWMDDPNWTDKDMAMKAERTITVDDKQDLQALFYYNDVQSSASWYGVSEKESKFVSFSLEDQAAEVAKAKTPDGTNIKAGDFAEDSWFYIDGTNVKQLAFSGLEDEQELETEDNKAEIIATGAPSGVTDVAYHLSGKMMYAVAEQKLYLVDTDEKGLVELGTFEYKEKAVTITSLAIDLKGVMYALAAGEEGVLYTVDQIDEDAKKVFLEIVGDEENGGKIGATVSTDPQAIAFDYATGELIWGAPDYLRLINTDNARAHIIGDLGQTGGKQGAVKALHHKDKLVTIKVQVDPDHEDWGTVSINNGSKTSVKVLAGTKVTINATPASSNYKFRYWLRKGSEEEIEDNPYTFKAAKSTTYTAYFKKKPQEEGIEDVESQKSGAESQKLLIDGQIIILRDGKMYNVLGAEVK